MTERKTSEPGKKDEEELDPFTPIGITTFLNKYYHLPKEELISLLNKGFTLAEGGRGPLGRPKDIYNVAYLVFRNPENPTSLVRTFFVNKQITGGAFSHVISTGLLDQNVKPEEEAVNREKFSIICGSSTTQELIDNVKWIEDNLQEK